MSLSLTSRTHMHIHTVMHHSRHHTGEQHWLLSGAIKGFDANQSSLSCQFGMMVEIYNKEKAFIADAQCLTDVIALYLIH